MELELLELGPDEQMLDNQMATVTPSCRILIPYLVIHRLFLPLVLYRAGHPSGYPLALLHRHLLWLHPQLLHHLALHWMILLHP